MAPSYTRDIELLGLRTWSV